MSAPPQSNKAQTLLGSFNATGQNDFVKWINSFSCSGGIRINCDNGLRATNLPPIGNYFDGWLHYVNAADKAVTLYEISGQYSYLGLFTSAGFQGWTRLATAEPLQMYNLPVADGFKGTIKYGKNAFDTVFIDLQHMAYASGSGPNGPIIGTLPEGYFNRPFSTSATFVVASDIGRSGYLRIEADGRLIVDCGDGGGTLTGWGGCVSFPLYTSGS